MKEIIKSDELNLLIYKILTEREQDVFKELSKGTTNNEIAKTLFISVNTVKTHLKNIYGKLNVKNRTQAVKKVNNMGN